MNITLPLAEMTTPEKLRTMEALWENLSLNSDELIAPPWHGEILAERDRRIEDGTEKVIDWNKAKKHIRESI